MDIDVWLPTVIVGLLTALYGAVFLGAVGAAGFLFRKLSQVEAQIQELSRAVALAERAHERLERLQGFARSLGEEWIPYDHGRTDDA